MFLFSSNKNEEISKPNSGEVRKDSLKRKKMTPEKRQIATHDDDYDEYFQRLFNNKSYEDKKEV